MQYVYRLICVNIIVYHIACSVKMFLYLLFRTKFDDNARITVQRSKHFYFCLLFTWRKFARCFALAVARIPSPGIPDVYIGQEMRVAPIDRPWDTSSRTRISRFRGCAALSWTSYHHIRTLNMRTINEEACQTFQSDLKQPGRLHRRIWFA